MTFGDNGGYWNENVVWEVEEVSGNGGGGKARLKAKKYKIFTELHRFSSPQRRKNKTFRTKREKKLQLLLICSPTGVGKQKTLILQSFFPIKKLLRLKLFVLEKIFVNSSSLLQNEQGGIKT